MLKRLPWLLLALVLTACARNAVDLTPESKLIKANELYADKKYARAALLYDDISFEKKSGNAAFALMKLADCYFKLNKFTDARLKYTALTTSYPDYDEVETAYYRIGECYYEESLPPQYDQTETVQSIEAFKAFIERFPTSRNYLNAVEYIRKAQFKLLQKKFYSGYIYYKMKDYSSAMMYFREIINLSNRNDIDRKSLYYAIMISIYHKDTETANQYWQKLRQNYTGSKEAKKLAKYFQEKGVSGK